jgi:hypothetical protein
MSVREVLASDVRVGQEVRVTGRCTGYSERATLGTPPVSRSDWLLEGDGATIFVNGALPQGCTVTGGSTATTTIRARVAEDTLRALGGRPPAPRRTKTERPARELRPSAATRFPKIVASAVRIPRRSLRLSE